MGDYEALSVKIEEFDDARVVLLEGEIDMYTTPVLRDELVTSLASARRVVVDLAAVTFVDSTGLGAFVHAHNEASARHSSFALRSVPPHASKLLEITGMHKLLDIEDHESV